MIEQAIWVTWESQRRNRELAAALGIELYEWADIDAIGSRAKKYSVGLLRTCRLLLRKRPRLVVCMNPSLVLAFFLVLVKRIGRFRVFVDAHNAGLQPLEGKSTLLNRLSGFILRHADLTIVSNDNLRAEVEARRGRGFTLPDRIPDLPTNLGRDLPGKSNLLFICSYAADEPYANVFEAARGLDRDITVYVTGDYGKLQSVPPDLPENVTLTGFLPEEEFVALLNSADAIIDLTTRENCLVCGAYEATALGKPMVLSDTAALRQYFDAGAVYTRHTAAALRQSFLTVIENRDELARQAVELKARREAEWKTQRTAMIAAMRQAVH